MFSEHLGFNPTNYQLLLEQIYALAMDTDAIFHFKDIHGERYHGDLEIKGVNPDQTEIVRVGWIFFPDSDIARLTTLFIKRRS